MRYLFTFLLLLAIATMLGAQPAGYWHEVPRELRYTPEGDDFVIVNGNKRFNRALYGTNTAFRVETGDMPEFGLFMPHMGGNIQLGFLSGDKSLWLNDARHIKSRYRAGSRIYDINDPLLGTGQIIITALAMADAEGIIVKIEPKNLPAGSRLITTFGGASNSRFSRNGDLGVDDPEAFSLKPEACEGNIFTYQSESFRLTYGADTRGGPRNTVGTFSQGTTLKSGSPYSMESVSTLVQSEATDNKPILVAQTPLTGNPVYFAVKAEDKQTLSPAVLAPLFNKAEERRATIASSVEIRTPDPFLNTLGGVLSMAADGIWDDETEVWQHGAIGWRMPLNGWRAAYTGDAIGWHERARKHFNGYAASQVTTVEPVIAHPAQDSTLNLTRAEKRWGTQMYSNGYISRNPRNSTQMHHYDMNLVYIDELLWHFNWTGDMDYVKEMWPVLKHHLAWEKRNFDPDNDGLYDAYACIWASDALQYNSGGVTYSSAYNYRANRMAADIAEKIGEDPTPYRNEADKILQAINSTLWLPEQGWWAEYKDRMGNKMMHPHAGIWSVYHAIDSDIHTPFQAYQATRYIDKEIPHIPVRAKGLEMDHYQTIATTNWLPYSWSVNNVAFAEVAHTSLAYWQAGRNEEAFNLFKSNILDGMYLGSSPGNIGQISFYDAARGECYRDFGDPIGVYSRALIQGLYGILPDAMNDKLVIRPGFPAEWKYASLKTATVDFNFKREQQTDYYTIIPSFEREMALTLQLKAPYDRIKHIRVNGEKTDWQPVEAAGDPMISIVCNAAAEYRVTIEWGGEKIDNGPAVYTTAKGSNLIIHSDEPVTELYDPQQLLQDAVVTVETVTGTVKGALGHRTLFLKIAQRDLSWWRAVAVEVTEPFEVVYHPEEERLNFAIINHTAQSVRIELKVNGYTLHPAVMIPAKGNSISFTLPEQYACMGTNRVELSNNGAILFSRNIVNWNIRNHQATYEPICMDQYLNTAVNQIFTQEYLSPRSPYTTLQIPKQGIGEWCHPALTAEIDDSGLRRSSKDNIFQTPLGIPFRTPSDQRHNIAFTSLWDNYPEEVIVPLSGKSSHAYLLMAGTTNHMQAHVPNGEVVVRYTDGSESLLTLVNPENWVPIEQDFYLDGAAFRSDLPRPYRVALKSGKVSHNFDEDIPTDEVYGRSIDGGAGVILDLPLDPLKELESLRVKTIANEVIIGLMSVTLVR
ncbi:MAG: hypothetical protein A2071_12725 [Bacteroidetes bacterium GWC1_47_7]|nr:MAG: hypothetical protein A2071_12725 [Bacteroidetes bacterium GWC1_47_7]